MNFESLRCEEQYFFSTGALPGPSEKILPGPYRGQNEKSYRGPTGATKKIKSGAGGPGGKKKWVWNYPFYSTHVPETLTNGLLTQTRFLG